MQAISSVKTSTRVQLNQLKHKVLVDGSRCGHVTLSGQLRAGWSCWRTGPDDNIRAVKDHYDRASLPAHIRGDKNTVTAMATAKGLRSR